MLFKHIIMKPIYKFSILIMLVLVSGRLFPQQTLTIKCNTDACLGYHTYYSDGNVNAGDAIQNAAYMIPGWSGGYNVNRAVMYFDLSQLPSCKRIISAKLNLYSLAPCGSLPGHTGTNNSAVLRRVLQSWDEYTVTYNNQPDASEENQVILLPSTAYNQDYLNIDVTALINDMLTTNNYGFLLKLQNEETTNALTFCSSDYYDSSKHPSLTIEYEDLSNILPHADFTYDIDNFNVQFTNQSVNAESYSWDFGDGTSSTEMNPLHIYNHSGPYTVCLTVRNDCGTDVVCQNLRIQCTGPEALFSYIAEDYEVTFKNDSRDADHFFWDFGDGNSSIAENPQHIYLIAGDFIVRLIASNECGSDTIQKTVTIVQLPEPEFIFESDHLNVRFINQSAYAESYLWDFGDGQTSDIENPYHQFTDYGTYYVCLTASNASGFATICHDITLCVEPHTSFTYCVGGYSVGYKNNSSGATSYYWEFGDGEHSTEVNPYHTFDRPGEYVTTLFAINSCDTAIFSEKLILQNCENSGPGFGYTCDGRNIMLTFEQLPASGDFIVIYDVNGIRISQVALVSNSQRIPTANLESGLYILDFHLHGLSYQRRVMIIK